MISVSTVADRPNSIAESLRSATHELLGHSDSPRLDAEVLLGNLLGATRAALLLQGDETLCADTARVFRELITRRAAGVPVAYLTGIREFWSLPLKVTPAVLVPRPETELIVEQALALLGPAAAAPAVLDLGTGSGAIALAVALERPRARIVGVDLSEAAVRVARDNAIALGLGHIEWRVGSWVGARPRGGLPLLLPQPPPLSA